MANRLQDEYRNNVLGDDTYSNVQLDADTINGMFIDAADDTILASDGDMTMVASAARVPVYASTPSLASKTVGSLGVGVFDADNLVFSSLSGDEVENLILYKHTGTEATSILIAFWDTFDSGMPLTPNGGDVTVTWNASGIFSI